MSKYVDGPVNAIKIEGNVGGINKNLILLMDRHMQIDDESICMDSRSIHLKQYLINKFDSYKNISTKLDFFIEDDLEIHKNKNQSDWILTYKSIYINDIRKFFYKNFIFDKKKK